MRPLRKAGSTQGEGTHEVPGFSPQRERSVVSWPQSIHSAQLGGDKELSMFGKGQGGLENSQEKSADPNIPCSGQTDGSHRAK